MDYISLFNAVARIAKPSYIACSDLKSEEEKFSEAGFDSLDMLLISIYFCELYGISEEVGKQMKPTTLKEMLEFIQAHKTKEPESVEQAISEIK
jgi:acyl carrier protein